MELLKVVQTESLDKIKEIIKSKGIPINSKWLDYAVLNSAIECGRKDVAKYLLEKKCRVNKKSKPIELLNTPLHNAVKLGDLELINSLLEKKASISAVNSEGDTPLHIAFMTRQEKTVDAMLEYIENTENYENVKNNQGLTHMHIACSRNNGKIVENFLEAGADLNDAISVESALWPGYQALHFAVHFESLEVVAVLKKASNHANVEDSNGFNPLKLAYEKLKDLSAMVHILSTENMNVESDENKHLSLFHIACLRDDPVAVETFIKNGADVNLAVSRDATFCPLYTPLHFAVESNCKKNVELLLEHGANTQLRDKSDMTPLHLALYNEDHREQDTIADLLYKTVMNKETERPDCNGLTYFHIAVTRNDHRLVKKFLAKDVNVNDPVLWNLRKFAHYTPLHFSVLYGHTKMTELLIKRGANVNRSDSGLDGTPLHLAIETGRKDIIDLLLESGARVDEIRFHEQRTTLHILVLYCVYHTEDDSLLEYIERLVKLGCDVNAKDCDGNTALHLACSRLFNGGECARLLLEFGANIDIENEEGKTPFNTSFYLTCEVDGENYIMLYEHVQKLKALGFKVNPKNEICCESLIKANQQLIEELDSIQQHIQDEITKLKSVKFNKRVTLFDFLFFDPKKLINYVQNDVLENIVESEDLNDQYPLYAYLIKLQYQKGLDHLGANVVEKRSANVAYNMNFRSNKKRRIY